VSVLSNLLQSQRRTSGHIGRDAAPYTSGQLRFTPNLQAP